MKRNLHSLLFVFIDYLIAVSIWILFFYIRRDLLEEGRTNLSHHVFLKACVFGGFWVLLYSIAGFYIDIYKKSRIREFFSIFGLTILGGIAVFFIALLDDQGVINNANGYDYTKYYKTLGAFLILHFSITAVSKMIILSFTKRLIRKKKIWFNTLVIGSNKNAVDIIEEINNINYSLGIRFIGYTYVSEKTRNLLGDTLRNFGKYQNIPKIIKRCRIENVIIAVESSEHEKITEILTIIEGHNVKISIVPDVYQMLTGSAKINHVLGVPLMEINRDLMPVWQKVTKRAMDILISFFVLTIGFVFLLIFGIITKLTSKGPIFYSQERIGKGKIPFRIYKFRSMFVDAEKEGPQLSSENDPRITKWGRFMRKMRIDELPQFYNVFIGDMSLVGPRPERMYFIDKITKEVPNYRFLLRVKPGITSLGQVKYGYAENVEQMVKRVRFDIIYIENMSLSMDFRIMLYTLLIVLQGRGK